MDRETIVFYLNKLKVKLFNALQNQSNYTYTNAALEYIEQIIDICDLLEREYFENIKEIKNLLILTRSAIRNNDCDTAKQLIEIKIKELESPSKTIPVQIRN